METDYESMLTLDKISKVSIEIHNIYDELFNLETNEKKNTEIYIKLLEQLKINIAIERKLYQSINSPEKIVNVLKIIFPKNIIKLPQPLAFKDIFLQENKNPEETIIIINRIKGKLFNILIKKLKVLKQNSDKIEEVINIDVYNKFIELIDSKINCITKEEAKSLIFTKYQLSYVYEDIEKNLLSNNFISPSTTINSDIAACILEMNKEEYQEILNNTLFDKISRLIAVVLAFDDKDYEDSSTNLLIKTVILLLRANLLMLDDDGIEEINIQFHNIIDSDTYTKKHQKNKENISENLIANAFKQYKNDKCKYLKKLTKY